MFREVGVNVSLRRDELICREYSFFFPLLRKPDTRLHCERTEHKSKCFCFALLFETKDFETKNIYHRGIVRALQASKDKHKFVLFWTIRNTGITTCKKTLLEHLEFSIVDFTLNE